MVVEIERSEDLQSPTKAEGIRDMCCSKVMT
jgi:hypothetical protein